MYYRRKVILALLQQFGGILTRTDLQKLLFLFCQNQKKPNYHFIPYKYGCFSFQANQDLTTMIKYKLIEYDNLRWEKVDKTNYINQLLIQDKINLVRLFNEFQNIRGDELIRYIYEKFPYYAINSEIYEKLLDKKIQEIIKYMKPKKDNFSIFTIGYEGKTVEEFANQLILEDIKVLCDVRKNPISMKYGFSKNQLKTIIENIGIKYIHFPELGIESVKRKTLESKMDYIKLFEFYSNNTLQQNNISIQKLLSVLKNEKRIALNCFEADFNFCHRSKIAEFLSTVYNEEIPIKHI